MKTVFVVMHEYFWVNHDEEKMIGVYATRSEAENAVSRARQLPGFVNWPEGFSIDEYELGQDHWTSGFATMVNILVPTNHLDKRYVGASTAWHPGDLYEICTLDDDVEAAACHFAVGNIVRCKEQDVDGVGRALVATELIKSRATNATV
ncbi:MAG: hypothetical protein HZA89_11535 [Verrucomicrobia bacterium]|nr:hypothetical protein [Verrucomicrobiota bacterium]